MNYHIKVKDINYIDSDTNESEVEFEFNGHNFTAFAYSDPYKINQEYTVELDFLEEEIDFSTILNENVKKETKIIRDSRDRLRYYCYGRIISITPCIVDLGVIKMNYNLQVKDDMLNKFIYFVISRLDIILKE